MIRIASIAMLWLSLFTLGVLAGGYVAGHIRYEAGYMQAVDDIYHPTAYAHAETPMDAMRYVHDQDTGLICESGEECGK